MLNFLQFQVDKVEQAGASLLSPGAIFSLPQLAVAFTIGLGFLALRQKRRRGQVRPRTILRALKISRRIVFSRSTGADLFYYFVNTFAIGGLIGWGIFSGLAVSGLIVRELDGAFGARPPLAGPEWALRASVTLVAFLGYELGYYVDHYLKHHVPFLWELHKTHHTAEVLTPLTVFRVHPLDTLIFVDIVAVTIGVLHGVFAYGVGRAPGVYTVGGANVLSVAGLFLLAQLQHSQFWIPLRGLPGRILLSPAHHQIHHSIDPAHHNRNLGSFLAVWDWMFGTLAVPPKEAPRLTFGVDQGADDPHRLSTLMIEPILGALAALRTAPRTGRP
jgi:sterol desaturase/sphingolipid hydroxylase (fatty acid hydroxylase superfamily)